MRRSAVLCVVLFACGAAGSTDYLMEGGDNGRTGWLRNDKSFNTSNVRNMKLLWKTKLDSVPREMHNLLPPMIATGVSTGPVRRTVHYGGVQQRRPRAKKPLAPETHP